MMTRVIAVLTAGLFTVAGVAAAQTSGASKMSTPQAPKTSMSQGKSVPAGTQTFLKTAAEGGLAEIDLATIADSKASNSQVKDLARTIKSDHEAANAELGTLAAEKKVMLPTSPNAAHKSDAGRYEKMSGAAFDKAYTADMVKDHRADIAAFQKHEKDPDPEVAAWVAKTLPTLQNHLRMAEAAQKAVGGK